MADEIQTAFIVLLDNVSWEQREALKTEATATVIASTLPSSAKQWLALIGNAPLTASQVSQRTAWQAFLTAMGSTF